MANFQELKNFNDICDEFIDGKYLLVDIKISSILNVINENEKLKNIVNNCLYDFDFSTQFSNDVADKEFSKTLTLPSSSQEIIAFVYTLLHKFKTGEVDFKKFIDNYFGNNNGKDFANKIINPFKEAVNDIFSKRHILVETDEYQSNQFNKIMQTVRLIIKNIDNYKLNMNQKEEFTMLLNSLYYASEQNNKKLVYSLMIGLEYFSKCNKKTRIAYLSLEECFEK